MATTKIKASGPTGIEVKEGYKETKLGWIPEEWDETVLMALCSDLSYGLTTRPQYEEDGIPLISAREIRSGIIDFNTAPRISEESYNRLSNKAKPETGDIFLSKTGTIGLVALYSGEIKIAITQNIAFVRTVDGNIDKSYLLQYF